MIWNRNLLAAEKLIESLQMQVISRFEVAFSPQTVAENADILVTCTNSAIPLLDIDDIPEGAHVNAIGACRPGFAEFQLRHRSGLKIVVDSMEACAREASELIGMEVDKEIGEYLCPDTPGRSSEKEITFFKSVGLGVEDIYAADLFERRARELNAKLKLNFGQQIELGLHYE